MEPQQVQANNLATKVSGPVGQMDAEARKRYVRRVILKSLPFVPLILGSVLTTKAVALTKTLAPLLSM